MNPCTPIGQRVFLGIAFLVCFLGFNISAADQAVWKVGLASRNITPTVGLKMYGYGSRTKPSEGVKCAIWVKAMALEDAEGNQGVIVTTDLGAVWPSFTDPVVERVQKVTGLRKDQIVFTSSHNHSGPLPRMDESVSDGWTEEEVRNSVAYTHKVIDDFTAAVVEAWKARKPAKLSWGMGFAPFVMNRREFTERGVILGDQFSGPADRSVPVLRVTDMKGKVRGMLFGTACHNTTLGGKNMAITGDFAGYAQKYIEDTMPGVQAMFITGCAGDANPYPRDRTEGTDGWDHVEAHGETLGKEVCRLAAKELVPVRGPLKTAAGVAEIPFQSKLSREALQTVANGRQRSPASNAKALLRILDRGEPLPLSQNAPVSVWQFGGDLTWVALSGEVVVDYLYLIQNALGPLKLWVSAYSHDVFGYVTSAKVQREGGYESKGITGRGIFDLEAQDAYVEKVEELAKKVGREVE